jgi:hypothetical protein
MIPRKRIAPNNRANLPLESFMGYQFAPGKFPKSKEEQSIVTWNSPGKGQQGESVTGGSNKQIIIRKQHNTRAN